MSRHQIGIDMTLSPLESVPISSVERGLLAVMGNEMPPRDPNNDDDDDEEEDEEGEDLEPQCQQGARHLADPVIAVATNIRADLSVPFSRLGCSRNVGW